MAVVYVLFSKSIDKYYVGSCSNLTRRLEEHNSHEYSSGFTRRASDWEVYFSIDWLKPHQARDIEKHIKRMKSRKYIENLILYSEMVKKLVKKYK
jgi:putative endonuclease